jgi:sterol desaturase/sphingolipid hydroxylase (fatty acid hydroxylase superfamily)
LQNPFEMMHLQQDQMPEAGGSAGLKCWQVECSWAIFRPASSGVSGLNRTRLVRPWPYGAAMGVLIVGLAVLIGYEWQAVSDLWSRVVEPIGPKWRHVLFGPAAQMLAFTLALMVMEPFFLTWEKTTIFGVFVRRNISAITDLGFMIAFLTKLKLMVQYVATFGLAYVGAKIADALPGHLGSYRLELPSEGVLGITAGFAVFYIVSSFVGYWQHRLMHWRGFWQLHRFHHAATELNILTGFRDNPGEAIVNAFVAISPLALLKMPDAGLFASFVLANQIIASLQHSELPWSYGWVGQWLVASPNMHQIHHSIDEEHRDKNFSVCPLWDRMFGTWYDGPNRPSAYGIPDLAHVERPLTQWMIDIWIFYRDAARALAGFARSAVDRVRRRPSSPDELDPTASIPAE